MTTDANQPVAASQAITAAEAALAQSCAGWRARRRCVDPSGAQLSHPHPACLDAQYRHAVILLEHGLPRAATARAVS